MLVYAQQLENYLSTDEGAQAYLEHIRREHIGKGGEEFTFYYVLLHELNDFQKKWNKDKQYKSYEKAAKKLEKEKKKEEYTFWLQQQYVEGMMGGTSVVETMIEGDARQRAFMLEPLEQELKKAVMEEAVETAVLTALTGSTGLLAKTADTASDAAKAASRLDTVADTLDNLSDAERALDKIRDVEKIDDVTDAVRDIDRIDDLNDALRATEKVVEGGRTTIHNDILDSPRTGSALKVDDVNPIYKINEKTGKLQIVKEFPATAQSHGFNDVVDNYAGYATKTPLNNATLYQLDGSLNGVAGRFEWIIQGGKVTHRMFIQNGTMNGVPIKP